MKSTTDLKAILSVGELLHYAANHAFDDRETSLRQGLDALEEALARGQLGSLVAFPSGGCARPRKYEIAAALNRLADTQVYLNALEGAYPVRGNQNALRARRRLYDHWCYRR